MIRLRRIVKNKKSEVVFLTETLCPVSLSDMFCTSVGLCNVAGVDPQGKKVDMFWPRLRM